MLPPNKFLPETNLKWVHGLLKALPVLPGHPPPPPIELQPDCDFLSLPAEVRLCIYEYASEDDDYVRLTYVPLGYNYRTNRLLNFARTCRQTRYELLPTLWKTMSLQVDAMAMMTLRGVRGIFDPERVFHVFPIETVLQNRIRRRSPTNQEVFTVQSLLLCLEVFPNAEGVKLRPGMKVSLEEDDEDDEDAPFKEKIIRDLHARTGDFKSKLKKNNRWLNVLASRIYGVLTSQQTGETSTIDLELQCHLNVDYDAEASGYNDEDDLARFGVRRLARILQSLQY
jgi:hypothetical protein